MGTARAAAAEFPMVAVHRTDRGSGPAWQARRGQELHPRIAGQASKHFNSICARNPPVRRHGKLRALSRWPPHGRSARLSAPLSTQSVLQCPDFVQVVRRWRRWVNHLWIADTRRVPACPYRVQDCAMGRDPDRIAHSIEIQSTILTGIGLLCGSASRRQDAQCRGLLWVNRVGLAEPLRLPVYPGVRTFSG
jgi:hypothetical protein